MVYSHIYDANPTLDSNDDRNILEQNHVPYRTFNYNNNKAPTTAKYRVAICFNNQTSINIIENTGNEKNITIKSTHSNFTHTI